MLKIELLKSKNLLNDINRFKVSVPLNLMGEYIKEIIKIDNVRKIILGKSIYRIYDDFITKRIKLTNTDLNRNLYWCACILCEHKDILNNFIILRDEFSLKLISGEYDHAEKILDKIELNFGLSYWLIENKIALLGISKGLSGQSDYANEIILDCSEQSLFQVLFSKIINRCIPNTSWEKYCDSVNETTNELQAANQTAMYSYIDYKLNFYGTKKQLNVADIIDYESVSSIIDRYLTFIRISQIVQSYTFEDSNSIKMSYIINKIKNDILDWNIDRIYCDINNIQYKNYSNEISEALNSYTIGDYLKAKNLIENCLNENKNITFLYEVYAKCLMFLSEKNVSLSKSTMSNKICEYMLSIVIRDENYDNSKNSLLKLISSFHHLGQMSYFYYFIDRECSCRLESKNTWIDKFAILNSESFNPIEITIFNDLNYTNNVLEDSGITMNFLKIIGEKSIDKILGLDIPNDRKIYYSLMLNQDSGDIENALNNCEELILSKNIYYRYLGVCEKINCYFIKGDYEKCVYILKCAFMDYKNIYDKLPVELIIDKIEKNKLNSILFSIEFLFVYHLYIKNCGINKAVNFKFYFDGFCKKNNIIKPIEIINKISIPTNELKYFLRYICTTDIIEVLDIWESDEEINMERIHICQELIKLDNDQINQKIYDDEIEMLTEKIFIDKSSSRILGGKIDVEIESILKEKGESLSIIYEKYYKSLVQNSIGSSGINVGTIESEQNLDILYFSLIDEIKNEFLFNQTFGLHGNLSVEFRHGKFESIIRSPLKSTHLVTESNKKNEYEDNKYWSDYYSIVTRKVIQEVNSSFKIFSENIDKIIEDAETKWCTIDRKESLFKFSDVNTRLLDFKYNINNDLMSYHFIRSILKELLNILDEKLIDIRKDVKIRLHSRIDSAFLELERNLQKAKGKIPLSDLETTIFSTRSLLNDAIDEICLRFDLSSKFECNNFDIKIPVKICESTIYKMFSYYNFILNISIDDKINMQFDGKYLYPIFCVILNLFENIFKHSKLDNGLIINLDVVLSEKNLHIHMKNNISKTINILDKRIILSNIKNKIDKKEYLSLVNSEGHTGLYKIEKILDTNINKNHTMNFEINDNFAFETKIDISLQGLLS